MNQKGESILLSILFLLIFSLSFLSYIQYEKLNYSNLKAKLNLSLCHKALMSYQKKLTQSILRKNKDIKNINALILLGNLKPTLKLVLIRLKKVIQAKQSIDLFSYLKKMKELNLKNCIYSINTYKTPFKISSMMTLNRDHEGKAILRSQKWTNWSKLKSDLSLKKLSLKSNVLGLKLKQKSTAAL